MKIRIFVTDKEGYKEEITDMYWFEENGVHDLSGGDAWTGFYTFTMSIDGGKEVKIESGTPFEW
jgi:hypothetical protein